MPETVPRNSWWVIQEDALLDSLRRAAAGENPDLVYAELYASASHETPGSDD